MIREICHWLLIWTGSNNVSGTQYGFWSGFGSDISEFGILIGLYLHLKHKNCHVKGCMRLGHQVSGTPFIACKKHNPGMPQGDITGFHIFNAHKKANE